MNRSLLKNLEEYDLVKSYYKGVFKILAFNEPDKGRVVVTLQKVATRHLQSCKFEIRKCHINWCKHITRTELAYLIENKVISSQCYDLNKYK